ncbi:MAG: ABC transporter substrate-binding protein [Clostridiales bacterium]|nr:ABC transporter substrate-binding protein [Clostridiales bacterium]
MRMKKSVKRFFVFIILLLICMILYSINKEKGLLNNLILEDENVGQTENVENYEKIINISLVNVDTFNPILTKNTDVINFLNLVYDSLFYYDKEMKLKSNIVEEYNYNANTLFIRIKKDILWSDGTEFTTKDINFTIEMIKQYGGIYLSCIDNIETIEIIDNWNIKFVLKEPNNLKHYSLIFPIMCQKYYENEAFDVSTRNNIPVGTGIFRYGEKVSDTVHIYKLNAFKNTQNIKIEQITVNMYSTVGEAFANLKNKKTDIVNTGLTNYEEHLGTIGYGKLEYANNTFLCLGINKNNSYLSNVNIRKSINEVIDKQAIWQNVYNSKGIISQSNIYPNSYYYQNEEYVYNVDKAKQDFVNSNISDNIVLNLVIKENNEKHTNISNMLKEYLNKLNIKLNVISVNNTEYAKRLQEKNYDLVLVNFDMPRVIDFNMYYSDKYNGLFNLNNEQIRTKISNINDENSLKEVMNEIQNIILNDIPFIGIGFEKGTVLSNNNLIGLSNVNYLSIYYDINTMYKKR